MSNPNRSFTHDPAANAQWAQSELGAIELGDVRSNRRMVKVFSQMLNSPGKSIPQCSASVAEAKAFYRLLDADTLTESLLFEVHRQAVLRRAQQSGCGVLLAIQDTTSCNFDTHHSLAGLGAISSNQLRKDFKGLNVHSTLLTAADEEAVFGLLGAKFYARKALRKKQPPETRNRERIEDKESVRWLESLELARQARQTLQEAETPQGVKAPLILSVGDREADIYELMVEAQQHRDQGLGLLVRCQHDRTLVDDNGADMQEAQMWSRLGQGAPAGSFTLKLPRSQGQKAREVTLSVRFDIVTIAVPRHKAKYLKMDTPVEASIVELREADVPKGKGICWRLLSTLKVDTLEAAIQQARWYAKRWQIEEFHRVLKTGCRVEARQMRSLERLKPMMALDMLVACRIMGMSAGARQCPQTRATEWLDEDEINALEAYENPGSKPTNDAPPMSLGAAVKSIARLGGHLGRNGDAPPPPSPSAVARAQQAQPLHRGLAQVPQSINLWVKLSHLPAKRVAADPAGPLSQRGAQSLGRQFQRTETQGPAMPPEGGIAAAKATGVFDAVRQQLNRDDSPHFMDEDGNLRPRDEARQQDAPALRDPRSPQGGAGAPTRSAWGTEHAAATDDDFSRSTRAAPSAPDDTRPWYLPPINPADLDPQHHDDDAAAGSHFAPKGRPEAHDLVYRFNGNPEEARERARSFMHNVADVYGTSPQTAASAKATTSSSAISSQKEVQSSESPVHQQQRFVLVIIRVSKKEGMSQKKWMTGTRLFATRMEL